MNKHIENLRNFIKSQKADAILINSADEFLSEYNLLPLNSRYKVTGFSGSTGDCLVTQNKVYQIADGRYHQQADNEVDHETTEVLKMIQGGSQTDEIVKVLGKNSTLLVTANKVSQYFCEILEKKCGKKSINIKYINNDPVDDLTQNNYTNVNLKPVEKKFAGKSHEEKFKYFMSKVKDNQVLLVTMPVNFAYLTNLRNYDFPYSSAPRAKAVITKKKIVLFTNSKIPYKAAELEVKKLSDFKTYLKTLKDSEILTDKTTVTKADFMQIDKSNKIKSSKIFDKKSCKNRAEIEHLKDAFKRTDRVLRRMENLINSDKKLSEYDLYCAITEFFAQEGAYAQSFKPIIASGADSSIIHYTVASKSKIIKDGDFVMIDCGGFFEGGLATDITRTFIKGKPTEEQKRIYTKVFQAFVSTYTKKYKKTATWHDIDKNTRNKLKSEEKNGWYFSHSTGHGIGISVHEFPPRCAQLKIYKKTFKKNYVFSIEPGLYKKGTGGVRLENAVYVKDISDKMVLEVLSHYPFDEKLINREMLSKSELKFLEAWQNYGKDNYIDI
ncbi:MAG: M24 family metallopeptidase [Candidatus Gastranaerophilales bacterium]|nr:M24 family metallopeptidase [Candidatus Gastranaerophilales bacterium]